MGIHELAGKIAPYTSLINVPRLISAYFNNKPDAHIPAQQVAFGTSGHRGSSLLYSFNEDHILAICQAVSEIRKLNGVTGPLFLGMDTHALSEPALYSAMEVFAGNGVDIVVSEGIGYTPTPVISHAILTHNQDRKSGLADGVVITPSHNPPDDGGIKYNPPNGGPADTTTTKLIQNRANEIMLNKLVEVKRVAINRAMRAETTHFRDYIMPYITDLNNVIDLERIASAGLKIGVDPMGGAGVAFWQPMAEMYGLNIEIVNPRVDPTYSFMTLDYDGKIRMDCSSPFAMASLVGMKDNFDIAFGNDSDYDRHGIVTRSVGLMNPNHFLATSIYYLYQNRPGWAKDVAVGKTIVSSSMIDRVTAYLGRRLCEVPVGFKWFVDGLLDGTLGFGGEESAGASFLRKNGSVWTTDKDGFILDLVAAEILAVTGRDPGEHYQILEQKFGRTWYARVDAPTTAAEKTILSNLDPARVAASTLAGDNIVAKLTQAPCNHAAIGGLKVITESGWFAARPSGTENVYKIYAESFVGEDHLKKIQSEAQIIVDSALKG